MVNPKYNIIKYVILISSNNFNDKQVSIISFKWFVI